MLGLNPHKFKVIKYRQMLGYNTLLTVYFNDCHIYILHVLEYT